MKKEKMKEPLEVVLALLVAQNNAMKKSTGCSIFFHASSLNLLGKAAVTCFSQGSGHSTVCCMVIGFIVRLMIPHLVIKSMKAQQYHRSNGPSITSIPSSPTSSSSKYAMGSSYSSATNLRRNSSHDHGSNISQLLLKKL
jgi:hypothetical protein